MKIISRFSFTKQDWKPCPTCYCDSFAYDLKKDARGLPVLVERSNKVPTYRMIQEACGPNVKEIIRRAALGDTSLLGNVKASYNDFVGAPRSLLEVCEMVRNTSDNFATLPTDLKEIFNNSADVMRQSLNDKSFDGKVKSYFDRFGKKEDIKGDVIAPKKDTEVVKHE